MKPATPVVVLVALAALLLASACKPTEAPSTSIVPSSVAAEPAATAGAAPAEAGNFTLKAASGELAQGADGELTLTIHPAAGFKINQEFPWKLTMTGDAVVEPTAAELPQDRWAMSDKEASVKIPVKVKAAGAGKPTGSVTFSVCNDSACDVIRDQAVAWEVSAR